MLNVLLGILAFSGFAQAGKGDPLVVCRANEQGKQAELVFRRMGQPPHFPLPPEFIYATFDGQPEDLERRAVYLGTSYSFQSKAHKLRSFLVSLDGGFEVQMKLFGESVVFAQGDCSDRP